MASAITDLIDRVSDSTTGRPIIADLAAPGKAIAAASINVSAATNWTTTTAIHFSIYETTTVGSTVIKNASTQTDWKGTLSGTAISNLTLTGGTDRAYTAGAKVELTPTSRYAKDLYDWATNRHNQDGTHKAFTESNIVPTAAIQDTAVTKAKLNTASFIGTTDANGWAITYNTWGKKVYTKKVSQAISLGAGISFANYTLATTPVDVGTNIANYYCNFTTLVPSGGRQMSTSFMYSASIIELGAINTFTGGSYAATVVCTLIITEA